MDPDRRILDGGWVLVRDGHIAAVGSADQSPPSATADEIIDASRKVVMPGMVDSHGHAGHSLVKSFASGDVAAWTAACLKLYALGSSAAFWQAEARLASLERLKAGVTTSISLMGGGTDLLRNDTPEYALAYAQAVGEAGTRAYLAVGPNRPPYPHRFVRQEDGTEHVVDLAEQMQVVETLLADHGSSHEKRVNFCLTAPVFGPGKANAENLDFAAIKVIFDPVMDQRQRHKVLFTQDGHQTGTLAFADRLGALGPWSLMSHSVDLDEADIACTVETGATIVHNPSAIRSITGRCPAPELIDAGARVVLGSDAGAPDRGYDMFKHMAQCMHYHRRHFRDPAVMPAGKVLEMATIDAAEGLGRAAELGSLEAGKIADIILVDLFKPHLAPINMPVLRLAHFANAADVHTVLVDGRIVLRDRKPTQVDELAVLEEAESEAARMIKDNGFENLLDPPEGFWRSSGLRTKAPDQPA
jgi:5-methylthioadenosine/S-adenosylhomocysteine deaminase